MNQLVFLLSLRLKAVTRTILLAPVIWCTLATAMPLSAQTTRVLLPVAVSTPIPGANGSLWATDIVARNNGSQIVRFLFPFNVPFEDYYEYIYPNTTIHVGNNSPRGSMVFMPSEEATGMVFSIRVRDLSRQSETWGTEVPAVPESAAFTTTAHFLNIPTTTEFRVLLRIYDFNISPPTPNRQFSVKVFPLMGNAVLKEIVATTTAVPGEALAEAEVADLIPSTPGDAIRLEVAPLTEGKFWAFVSVTNNATQHVTLVTQQP